MRFSPRTPGLHRPGALSLLLLTLVSGLLRAESPELRDLDGGSHHPLDVAEERAGNVVIFIMDDCPIANALQPEIARIVADFEERFRFYLVHVDPDLPVAEAKAHAEEFALPGTILHDTGHDLVTATGATITPEAAVITPGGEVAYLGRINDLYAKLGQRRRAPRNHDLRDALAAIAEGRPPASARTKAVGCYIADFAPPAEGD